MWLYYTRLAWLSLKRHPLLSLLMSGAIALGIGAAMTTITINYLMSADPIPEKSDRLFYVQLDNWSPNEPYDEPNEPPDQLTYTDATALKAQAPAQLQTALAQSGGVIEPQGLGKEPFLARLRLTHNDFFTMFNAPFLYGQGWSDSADETGDRSIVLSKSANEEIFAGENSVGRTVRLEGKEFRVVGVLDEWVLKPRFYDVTTGAFNEMEDAYLPFKLKETMELPNSGNTNCWKMPEGEGFKSFLTSECVNFQFWVQLDSAQEKQEYVSFLNAYAEEQKKLGRFPRPLNNRLTDVMGWMEHENVVDDDAEVMMYLSLMFLAVCLLNTIGLLLTKFSFKTGEIALRRAVGATRMQLYQQQLVETVFIGVAGGIGGLILAALGLLGIEYLYGDQVKDLASLNLPLLGIGILLAIISSVLAGAYPTWRTCRIPPASQLKSE
ncbi:ABC transporter permease [Idiomarina baltica]|uniref:ABC transporter ATP-binding protein n=1 Tax=Idiomarina baltica OS145 TaxID=314276 RepID=A0ABP2CSZ4_9GAMM|nr:ABC transporter permease [Idiomarina baltica]EAQ32983.1 ABC transporter ATP-binding protein [Idiomarina baltica OS145]